MKSSQYPVWMNRKTRKEDFRELKSEKFPVGACPRTPLEACAIGARFGKSVISYRRFAPELVFTSEESLTLVKCDEDVFIQVGGGRVSLPS